MVKRQGLGVLGEWGGDDELGLSFIELVFLNFITEVIFLILKEFVFIEKMFSKTFRQTPYPTHPQCCSFLLGEYGLSEGILLIVKRCKSFVEERACRSKINSFQQLKVLLHVLLTPQVEPLWLEPRSVYSPYPTDLIFWLCSKFFYIYEAFARHVILS